MGRNTAGHPLTLKNPSAAVTAPAALRRRGRDLSVACVSGLLLVPCFPSFDLGFLAWGALVPLFVVLEEKPPTAALLLGLACGFVFFPGVFHWALSIPGYSVLDHALLALYLSLYFAIFGFAQAATRRRTRLPFVVIAPPLWVASEYLRAHASFLSFPWMLLGYSQYQYTSLIQISSFTGVYGLSFLIVLVNALGADLFVHYWRSVRTPGMAASTVFRPAQALSRLPRSVVISAGIVSLAVIGTYCYGSIVSALPTPGERLRIAVVQGNVPQQAANRSVVLDRYTALTMKAAQASPELIIWPETAVPGDVKHDPGLKRTLTGLSRETGAFLLAGSAQYAKFAREGPRDPALEGQLHNTLFLIAPNGTIGAEYRKIILVPFGEYEPLKGIVRWPKAIAASFGRMLPGDRYTVFAANGHRFGAVICWEAMFPHLFRQFVNAGATFMVSATNESWFGPTAAPYQLLAMTAIRAAENRTAIARAASTGLSTFIDPYGRIGKPLRGPGGRELFVDGMLTQEVPISRSQTFYTRYGDLFAFLQLGLSAALLAWCCIPNRAHAVRTPCEST